MERESGEGLRRGESKEGVGEAEGVTRISGEVAGEVIEVKGETNVVGSKVAKDGTLTRELVKEVERGLVEEKREEAGSVERVGVGREREGGGRGVVVGEGDLLSVIV